MSGYEYGNTRLRAMRSRLLDRRKLVELSEARSLPEFINQIAQTSYRKSIEMALVQTSDLESIYEALRRDFIDTIAKIRGFYEGETRHLVDLILREYDVHNLKTILRGLSQRVPQSEMDNTLLPTCDLPDALLNELMRASSPRGAIDLLATVRHPIAQPLLSLRAEQPGAELWAMERALDRWHFEETTRAVKAMPEEGQRVNAALRLEMDIRNILLVLRLIRYPAEQQALKLRVGQTGLEALLPTVGGLTVEQMNRMLATKHINTAIEQLADAPYIAMLREGTRLFDHSGQLSDIERALRRYQLHWLSSQIVQDPLGIGVVLGYLAEKVNEIANLRRMARGIQMHIAPGQIQAEMEFLE